MNKTPVQAEEKGDAAQTVCYQSLEHLTQDQKETSTLRPSKLASECEVKKNARVKAGSQNKEEIAQQSQRRNRKFGKSSESADLSHAKKGIRTDSSTLAPADEMAEKIKQVLNIRPVEEADIRDKRVKEPVTTLETVKGIHSGDKISDNISVAVSEQHEKPEPAAKPSKRRNRKKGKKPDQSSADDKDECGAPPKTAISDKPNHTQGESSKNNVEADGKANDRIKEKKKRNKKRQPKANVANVANVANDGQTVDKKSVALNNSTNLKAASPSKNLKLKEKSSFSELCRPRRRFSNEDIPVEINVYPHISTSTETAGSHRMKKTTKYQPVHPTIRLPKSKVSEKTSHAERDLTVKNENGQRVAPKENSRPPYLHRDDFLPPRRKPCYANFLDPSIVERAIAKGELYRGTLRINKRLRQDAYVTSDELDADIYICGQRDRNRALEGDVVAVRLLDVEKIWKIRKERQRRRNGQLTQSLPENENTDNEDTNEDVEDKGKPKYCGEVVCILYRVADQLFSGTLSVQRPQSGVSAKKEEEEEGAEEDPYNNEPDGQAEEAKQSKQKQSQGSHPRIVWFKPTDKRAPFIVIPSRLVPPDFFQRQEEYKNMVLVASVMQWPVFAQHPLGRIERILGHIGDFATETQAVLCDHGIKQSPYKNKHLAGLPPPSWTIPEVEYKNRRDLREVQIFTIDPATAKDLDDAVHIIPLGKDYFEVGVHIADVTYFLRANTPLDTEAFDRGTSTYLVDKVIPMLPSRLCEDLCSLNPGVERLAFSVIWKMDSTGKVVDTWFGRTIIKSCAKLAYGDAQSVIEGHGLPSTVKLFEHTVDKVEESILNLFKISQHMRKRRFENGALSISSIRLSFKLNEAGEPEDVFIYELKEANRLIEEFMLLANMSVAEKISKHYPNEALLRRHEPPIPKRLDEFLNHAEELGYSMDGSSAGALQASFDAIDSDDVKSVLRILAVKPMRRAKYFCTGALDIAKYLHFALNVPLYTHFTSPIRRYADVIVHRQLAAALQMKGNKSEYVLANYNGLYTETCGYDTKKVRQMAMHCNQRKDGAKNAQEQNIMLYLARYLSNLQKEGPIIRGAICLQVSKDALDILVPEYGLERRIHADSLPIVRHTFDPNQISLAIYWKKTQEENADIPNNPDVSACDGSVENQSDNSEDDVSAIDSNEDIALVDDDIEKPCPGKAIVQIPDNVIVHDKDIDVDTCMQRFKAFSKLDVRIKVDETYSPPVICVYPVNPFLEASL